MNTPPFEPLRFLDQPLQERQGEVARLIRHAIGASEKPTPVLKGRIRQTLRRRSVTRRRAMRALLVGGAIFVSGGVVGAVVQPILRLRSQAKIETVESVSSSSPSRRTRVARPARPPSGSTISPPAPESPAPLEVTQVPVPAGAIPVPIVPAAPSDPMAAPTLPRVEASPASPPRTKRAERPAPGIRSEPVRSQAVSHPVQVAMREPPKIIPSVEIPAPTPLQPPAFKAPALPLSAESAGQVPNAPSSFLGTPPKVTSRPPQANLPPETTPTPRPAPQASEQVLVARALSSLRVQHRPATALAALDEYEARFPKGNLLAEVARLRAEALLVLGQRRAALDELSREPAVGATMDEESRLVRAELRASEGRWREAAQDFDLLLSAWLARDPRGDLSPKLQGRFERALWGRACARSQLRDEAGARADLQQLMLRFPQGRFAAQAARRLGEPPSR